MPGKPRYRPEEVIEAFESSRLPKGSQKGIIQRTAARLGCTRQTVHNYINRWPKVWEAYMRVRHNYGITWGPGISPDIRFDYHDIARMQFV